MDSDEFRAILSRSAVGIWEMIDAAIRVAGSDYGDELLRRRDRIVESLYAPPGRLCARCGGEGNGDVEVDRRRNDNNNNNNIDVDEFDDGIDRDEEKSVRNLNEDFGGSPVHQNLSGGEEEGEDLDPLGGLFDDDDDQDGDDEQRKILSIKEQLEDPQQSEDDVVELLQSLADMDITFQALKDTDIGRYVNRLRKHSCAEVRRLVKHLVRKWKETVDKWVKVHELQRTPNLIADADSPQRSMPKNQQNGHHQVPDFGYSPNPRSGNSSAEPETKPKQLQSASRREPPTRQPQSVPKSASTPPNRTHRESVADDERLDSARKRLQQNYQEAQNAKKQRTIQVMDIHDIPKPKKSFFPKKGGFQGRFSR